MAITTIKETTGASWPTSGAVSTANLGCNISGGDGYVGGAGTYTAWVPGTPKTAQPSWSASASYIVWSNTGGSSLGCCELCTYASASANLGYAGDGVEISFGLQLRLDSFVEGTTPATNTTKYLTQLRDGAADYPFQIQISTRNLGGFAPGWVIGNGYGQTGATFQKADLQGGGSSSDPACHLRFDEWYQVRMRYKPPSASAANDGKFWLYLNDTLVFKSSNIDGDLPTASNIAMFLAMMNRYGAALTGVSVCTCGPFLVRTYPDADASTAWLQTNPWDVSIDRDSDVARHWHAYFTGVDSPWTKSGALSIPDLGTRISTSGIYPGMAYVPISATAGNGANLDSPDIWDGTGTGPFDSHGNVHVSFNLVMPGAASVINGYVYAEDNTTDLVSWQIDCNAGKFYVNGVEELSGIPDSQNWQVVVQMGPGSATVLLNNRSNDTIDTGLAWAFATDCDYMAGDPIGKARQTAVGGATETVRLGSVTVARRHTVSFGDSYSGAAANLSSPEYHCQASRLGRHFNQSSDGLVPAGYDIVPQAGGITGINITTNLSRSGSKLSEVIDNVLPQIADMKPSRIIMLCYDVNDIPSFGSVTTMAAAWSVAETIAERKVAFVEWAISKGHTIIMTDGYNLTDAGSVFNGTDNLPRRKVPGMVSDILKTRMRQVSGTAGKLTFVPTALIVDPNAMVMSSDGFHPEPSSEVALTRALHDGASNIGTVDGYNLDGTLQRTSGSGSSSVVGRSVVVGG